MKSIKVLTTLMLGVVCVIHRTTWITASQLADGQWPLQHNHHHNHILQHQQPRQLRHLNPTDMHQNVHQTITSISNNFTLNRRQQQQQQVDGDLNINNIDHGQPSSNNNIQQLSNNLNNRDNNSTNNQYNQIHHQYHRNSNKLPTTAPNLFMPSKKQYELIKSNPGSLQAVARALKMVIVECQYQMRNEPWDCPTYGFSIKPHEIFGILLSRSFKETSFIQSLISSAIAHSITRACTESTISTCSRMNSPYGNGFSEDIEFGLQFAERFMELTHEQPTSLQSNNNNDNHHQHHNNNNHQASQQVHSSKVATSGLLASSSSLNNMVEQQNLIQTAVSASNNEPMWKEKRLRHMINAHNYEVGRLLIFNGKRKECKCHGLSGACTLETCWLKLPSFRDVANRLHDSLDQALRVEMYVAHTSNGGSNQLNAPPSNHYKSLTSAPMATTKKSNKKRSSSSIQTAIALNGLGRLSSPTKSKGSSGNFVGPGAGRLQQAFIHEVNMNNKANAATIDNAHPILTANTGSIDAAGQSSSREFINIDNSGANSSVDNYYDKTNFIAPTNKASISPQSNSLTGLNATVATTSPTNVVKKRPIARSIGITAATISPGKFDLLYAEESPDFCVPSEKYNIKGTKGRLCSESSNASNSCERLCCGRGYKTEIREERYKCECKFQYCCKLECKTCTRRKTLHKCL